MSHYASQRPLVAAWILSVIGTATSLYWSQVLRWIPCDLCWYQRICMYPMVLVLGFAVFSRDKRGMGPAWVLVPVGLLLGIYNYLLQVIPSLGASTYCLSVVSCSEAEFRWFGFITPPFLSSLGFLLIGVCLALYWRRPQR